MASYAEYSEERRARFARSLEIRARFGATWKVVCGYTIWDSSCGAILDLEDTAGWAKALKAAHGALWHLEIQEYHAQYGVLAIWRQRREIWNLDLLRAARRSPKL